ncbi:multicopper oxidase domain-containing protein [Candidatus Nitrosocosmicus agrestis]|jgi:FtsP/CotA-like multicopper oxidase with cupredoxin domain|uniref:multicopper oxidase domain-containing protein n=1 Tax=Candidatus Nitrosocosmicus agrestis TaxID=2563600 RepID=UPI001E4D1A34|nr:multicopper oxidase domain-containing protein [Candidatus Nitrosocosmicus sp. SS]MDR4492719.1 multicopper oxidase domain-containing protein [Candidatus Nitrosocosmicus sp.]
MITHRNTLQSILALFAFLSFLTIVLYGNSVHASIINISRAGTDNSTNDDMVNLKNVLMQNHSNFANDPIYNGSLTVSEYDKFKNCAMDTDKRPTSIEYLTFFNCGHVISEIKNNSKNSFNQTTREFTLIIDENSSIPIASNGLVFDHAWTFNGTIPGPTMRVTEGDIVKIKVINPQNNNHTHSLHMHSIHPGDMDGVDGPGGYIKPGQNFTYIFKAGPYGVYPYHCHVSPVDQHINNGLYGALIIDPKIPRQNMTEMVMMMNGYDLDYEKEGVGPSRIPTPEEYEEDYMPQEFEHGNEVYTVNGKAFDYMENPIPIHQNTNYRIYLINMLEFDPVNSFHLHGNVFKYYPSGTSKIPSFVNDILTLGQGDRGIIEFSYPYTGQYMFHSHINEFSDLGWMGLFNVTK